MQKFQSRIGVTVIAQLDALLSELDQSEEYMEEYDIEQKIRGLHKFQEGEQPPMEFRAEGMAFTFMEAGSDRETSWGTYYGPMMTTTAEDGSLIEIPSRQLIDHEIIKYWKGRAQESANPVMRARYAGLVWEFSKFACNQRPDFAFARDHIESLISASELNQANPGRSIEDKLERAVILSIKLKADDLLERSRQAVIDYHSKIDCLEKRGYWGFAYRILMENKNTGVTDDQQEHIINSLAFRLEEISTNTNMDEPFEPWKFENAVLPLADFYKSQNNNEDLRRVINILGEAFLKASEHADGMLSSSWLQHMHAVYLQYGFRDEANKLSVQIHEKGPEVVEGLSSFSTEMKVSTEELDQYLDALTEGGLETALKRVAIHFIPKRDEVINQLKDLSEKTPFQFHITRQIQNMAGRVVAIVGSLDEDQEGHIVNLITQNSQISAFFLAHVFLRLKEKYDLNADALVDFLYQSPLFDEKRKRIVEKGLRAYFDEDYIIAVHILVPQIESSIRKLMELCRAPLLKPSRFGGFNLKVLGDMLADKVTIQIFGENLVFYFRSMLVDQRGFNIRNDICHGDIWDEGFSHMMADRIVHILLCLALVQKKAEES